MRDGLQPDVKLGDDLQLNIIEMKKADRLGVGGQSIQDWITLFEHWKEDDKMSAITNPAVKEVRGYIRELSADERERQRAEARMKAIRDEASLIEDATKKGRVEGEARLLGLQLKMKFGEIPQGVVDRLNSATSEQLESWGTKILTAQTLEELLAD